MRQYYSRTKDTRNILAVVLIGAAIMLALPVLNGGPFFYFDTATYVEQFAKVVGVLFPQPVDPIGQTVTVAATPKTFGTAQSDRVVIGGRSIYYAIYAYIGWVTTIWLPVILQSLTLSWLVVTLFRHLDIPMWEYGALATLGGLAALTSASFFVGLIMPDIWVGLMVLALALLWGVRSGLNRKNKIALLVVLSFAVLIHNSHLALLAALITLYLLMRILPRWRARCPWGLLVIPVTALGIGILGQIAFSTAVRTVYGAQIVNRPFITAHLVEMGAGTRLVQETCPQSGYALCDFADRLPVDWIAFLFDSDPKAGVFAAAAPVQQKLLSEEQMQFALHTLWAEPAATIIGLATDGVAQLWTLSMHDVALNRENDTYISTRFPPDLIELIQGTHIYGHPELLNALLRLVQVTGVMSAIASVLWALQRYSGDKHQSTASRRIDRVIIILIAGVVLNALICGVLASPYGRFQARIVWLLLLVPSLLITRLSIVRSQRMKLNLTAD